MSDGTRTHDRLDHNQELYQLSYAHRGMEQSTSACVVRRAGWVISAAGPVKRCGALRVVLRP